MYQFHMWINYQKYVKTNFGNEEDVLSLQKYASFLLVRDFWLHPFDLL